MTSPTSEAAAVAAGEDDRTLRIERRFAAPREVVFRAWTDPKALAKWWGPKGMTVPECEMDVRPGGAWRTTMRGEDGAHTVSGVYREIAPPERLVFTWGWETDGVRGHETEIAIDFHADGAATRMVFTQRLFESSQMRDNHNKGWSSSFLCLDEALSEGAIR